MGLRPATMHENRLAVKSFVFTGGFAYFHGSEGSAFYLFFNEEQQMLRFAPSKSRG